MNDFCIFIISYKRPVCHTAKMLKKHGYKGKFYIVLSTDDPTIDEYIKEYGEDIIIIFDKQDYKDKVDQCNNFDFMNAAVYARTFCIDCAKKLNYKYFYVLDDDITGVCFRYEKGGKLLNKSVADINEVIEALLEYYKNTSISSIGLSNGGSFIGGLKNKTYSERMSHFPINNFLCSTERYFPWMSIAYDDTCTQLWQEKIGINFYEIADATIQVKPQEQAAGGVEDFYKDFSVYWRRFHLLLGIPFCKLQIDIRKNGSLRCYVRKKPETIYVQILSDKYKKK